MCGTARDDYEEWTYVEFLAWKAETLAWLEAERPDRVDWFLARVAQLQISLGGRRRWLSVTPADWTATGDVDDHVYVTNDVDGCGPEPPDLLEQLYTAMLCDLAPPALAPVRRERQAA